MVLVRTSSTKNEQELILFLLVFESGNLVCIIFILGKYHVTLALP